VSDFDAVLERLLSDPGFKAALAADPGRALAGYRLTPDEVELLGVQLSADTGGNSQVEQRTSKASLFGLLGSMTGAGFGHAGGGAQGMQGAGVQGAGVQGGHGGFGGGTSGVGNTWPEVTEGPAQSGFGGGAGQIGTPVGGGHGSIGQSLDGIVHSGQGGQVPSGYHPNVDVDGDGNWDQYTVRARGDGGVDVVADMDHDGRADFVGHDVNRDGIVDSADYDEDHDGRLETHMTDVNGDGWMDTRAVDPQASTPTGQTWTADGQRFGPAG
jgi:hypothetical protein